MILYLKTTVKLSLIFYKKIGVSNTLELLAKKYPGGIKKEVELRREKTMEYDSFHHGKNDVIENLISELLAVDNPEVGKPA